MQLSYVKDRTSLTRDFSYWNVWTLTPMIIAIFILGSRYEVGIDYVEYLKSYIDYKSYLTFSFHNREIGYDLLNSALASLDAHFIWFFIITVALQFVFFYWAFDSLPHILPWALFFLFVTGALFGWLNVIRQYVTLSIFFYSIRFITKRQFLKYLFCCMLGFMWHKTAVVLLPLYFVAHKDLFKNRVYQYILFGLMFVIGAKIMNILWDKFSYLFSIIGYGSYVGSISDLKKIQLGSGMGMMAITLVDMMLIFYSNRLKVFFKNESFYVFYNIYFIGIVVEQMTKLVLELRRLNMYFVETRLIVLAFFAFYAFHCNKGNRIVDVHWPVYALLLFYIMMLMVSISNGASLCSPFQFFWERF